MTLEKDKQAKILTILELAAVEIAEKLSSLINRTVKINYKKNIDTHVVDGKFTNVRDSFLIYAPILIDSEEKGPASLITTNQTASVVADLIMGGAGDAPDGTKPDDTNQMVFSETINQVFKSTVMRLAGLNPDSKLDIGDNEYKLLEAIRDATLSAPKGTIDTACFEFEFNITAKLDGTFFLELNKELVDFLIDNLHTIAEETNFEEFKKSVQADYSTDDGTEEQQIDIEDETPDSEDAYKVDPRRNLGFLHDIHLDLIVELGRSEMLMKEILNLTKGSAIELDRQCNDPVDLYVHNQLVARGEVVAIDDCFGLKVTEVIGNLDLSEAVAAAAL